MTARGLPELAIGGLEPDAARELLASCDGRVSGRVAGALIEATGANPLALLEIPPLLSEGQRGGTEPVDEPLPVGERVARAFLARAADLSTGGRRALLVAAACAEADVGTIARTAGARGLDEAEASGLVRVRGGEVHFRHPLVRSAVYSAATASERNAAHLALAEALGAEDDGRSLWHRAQAAVGMDDGLADALDAAARRAAGRSVVDESRLLERSARLTSDPARRAQRLLRAGRAAGESGQTARASAMLSEGLELAEDPPLRADLIDAQLYIARASTARSAHGSRSASRRPGGWRRSTRSAPPTCSTTPGTTPPSGSRIAMRARSLRILRGLFDGREDVLPTACRRRSPGRASSTASEEASLEAARRGAAVELSGRHLSSTAVDFAECLTIHEEFDLARRLLESRG